jgi:glutamate-ammonia-ligase adenylyltransferase
VGQTSDEQNRIHELIEELRSIPILSRQKERDTGERDLFLTQFMNTLSEHQGNTVRSMQFLVDFVRSTKAKNNFFILLNRTPELLETFTWIFSRSPFMAQVLISRPELLDAFILRSQEDTSEESPDFLDALFERKLLHSLIAGSEFLRNLQVHPLTQHLTEMANEVAQKILHRLNDTYGARVGLVALGKWGGQELGFSSDLDFVFVTAHSETQDDSATEMAENNYKVAKRFVSWITELRKGGRFYNIDLRLRPLGSAGPLLMSWPELLSFLATQAPPWQRLSYLKARLVVAPNSDRLSTSHARQEILEAISQNPLSPEDITELHEIRRKLLVSDSWDIKKSPGGLIDIELSVHIALLSRGIQPKGTSIMSHFQDISQALHNVPAHESIALLMENYDKLRQIEQLMHLLSETNDHHPKPGTPLFTEIAQIFQRNPLDLERDFLSLFSANEKALMELQSDAEST